MQQIPDTVAAADVIGLDRRVRRRRRRLRHRRRLRGGQRRRRGRQGAGPRAGRGRGRHHVDGRRTLLPRRRHRGPAGHRARRLAPRRCTSTWSRCRSEPDLDKIRAYCDGSVEHFNWLRTWAFSSSAATTRARWSSRPAPRGCPTPATRRCGRSASRRSPRRAGTRCRYPANWVARRWSSTCCSSGPTSSGVQIRYETGVTEPRRRRGRRGGRRALEALHAKPVRSRPSRWSSPQAVSR